MVPKSDWRKLWREVTSVGVEANRRRHNERSCCDGVAVRQERSAAAQREPRLNMLESYDLQSPRLVSPSSATTHVLPWCLIPALPPLLSQCPSHRIWRCLEASLCQTVAACRHLRAVAAASTLWAGVCCCVAMVTSLWSEIAAAALFGRLEASAHLFCSPLPLKASIRD